MTFPIGLFFFFLRFALLVFPPPLSGGLGPGSRDVTNRRLIAEPERRYYPIYSKSAARTLLPECFPPFRPIPLRARSSGLSVCFLLFVLLVSSIRIIDECKRAVFCSLSAGAKSMRNRFEPVHDTRSAPLRVR